MRTVYTAALALAMAAGTAHAQLVVGNDNASGQLWVVDVSGGGGTRQILSGTDAQINGAAADNTTNTLYWLDGSTRLLKATMTTSGLLTPVVVGTFPGGATFASLAFDSTANKLYGYRNSASATTEGFYEISTVDATVTLQSLVATTATFLGFDYDSVTDSFYVTNDATTFPGAGRGLVKVTKPLTAPTYTLVTTYPGTDANVDGLAIGNGRAYLVNDNITDNIYVYNLTTNSYETTITAPYTSNGTNGGGAWAPGLIATAGADVSVSVADSPDPLVVPLANTITYTVTARNTGPDAAANVSLTGTLPSNVAFASVTSPGVHNSGVISANLGTLSNGATVSFDVTVTYTGSLPDVATFTMTGTSTTADPFTGNNSGTASTTVRAPQANVGIAIAGPAACSASPDLDFTYTLTASNAGTETAHNVVLDFTLPSNTTDGYFVSSTPAAVPSGNVLHFNLGSIAPSGTSVVSVVMHAVTPSAMLDSSATISADEVDTNITNNAANNSVTVAPLILAPNAFPSIFSTYVTQANSTVPGLSGIHFTTFDRPFASPDYTKIIMRVDTDAATTVDGMMLVYNGSTWSVVAREGSAIPGVTPAVAVNAVDATTGFDENCDINNAGNFAFSGNFTGATSDDFVVKNVGGVYSLMCDEDATTATAGSGGTTFNDVTGNVTITNDASNAVTWFGTLNGAATANDNIVVSADGSTILLQEGMNAPTGQADIAEIPTTNTWKAFNSGVGNGLSFNADHSHWILSGTINSATNNDTVVVVDNDVKLQEGRIPSGFSSAVLSVARIRMSASGDWYAQVGLADTNDAIVRNGSILVQTGDPVPGGLTGELIDDTSFSTTFFMLAANSSGAYVYGAVTNNADPLRDAVLIYNNTTVVARQNDPIDLNGDGIFNDDAYLRTFNDDNIFISNDAIYVSVSLRRGNAALCGGSDTTQSGFALLRIPLPFVCAADFNHDGDLNADDLGDFITCYFDVNCPDSDFNHDSSTNADDLGDFITAYFGGCD